MSNGFFFGSTEGGMHPNFSSMSSMSPLFLSGLRDQICRECAAASVTHFGGLLVVFSYKSMVAATNYITFAQSCLTIITSLMTKLSGFRLVITIRHVWR